MNQRKRAKKRQKDSRMKDEIRKTESMKNKIGKR